MLLRALIFLAAATLALRAEPVRVACLGDVMCVWGMRHSITIERPCFSNQLNIRLRE
jgi:hypothetical protein